MNLQKKSKVYLRGVPVTTFTEVQDVGGSSSFDPTDLLTCYPTETVENSYVFVAGYSDSEVKRSDVLVPGIFTGRLSIGDGDVY